MSTSGEYFQELLLRARRYGSHTTNWGQVTLIHPNLRAWPQMALRIVACDYHTPNTIYEGLTQTTQNNYCNKCLHETTLTTT